MWAGVWITNGLHAEPVVAAIVLGRHGAVAAGGAAGTYRLGTGIRIAVRSIAPIVVRRLASRLRCIGAGAVLVAAGSTKEGS